MDRILDEERTQEDDYELSLRPKYLREYKCIYKSG